MQSLNFAPGVFEEDCGTKKFFFCTSPGCETNPIFGLEWGVPLRCSSHKRSGDAFVHSNEKCYTKKHFFCSWPNCEANPIFGLDWGVPLRCSSHKRSGDALVYKVYSKDYSEVSSEVYSEETF